MAVFNHYFYNQTLRRYIVAFGNMFADMRVERFDSNGTRVQSIAVPIAYGPKEKWLARMTVDPTLNRAVAVQLPHMAFEIISMNYDGSRRLSSTTLNLAVNNSDANRFKAQYTPVPWNINFGLFIYVRNADDGAQLLEQILPFFGPEWTNSINLVPSMGLSLDVPTILTDMTTEDVYEGDFLTRRALIYTLNFTMKGYFFGPVKTSGSRTNVIKRIQLDFGVPSTANLFNSLDYITIDEEDIARTGRSSRVVITPGQLANGSPTTNSAASIDYNNISANSSWDYASNTFFYQDGLKYNPITGDDE